MRDTKLCCLATSGITSFFAAFCFLALSSLTAGAADNYRGKPFHYQMYHGGPQKVPGRVQCAYYDLGGEGVAYHDTDAKNKGSGTLNPADGSYLNEFRMREGVDTSYTKYHDDIDENPFEIVHPPKDVPYGRTYWAVDPEGHPWFFTTPLNAG